MANVSGLASKLWRSYSVAVIVILLAVVLAMPNTQQIMARFFFGS